MIYTGEQFIDNYSSSRLKDEHINRYIFAKNYCKNKRVLDIACGTGYGAYEISKVAEYVIGLDASCNAIAFAKEHYIEANLSYIHGDCAKKFFEKQKFDVILSFETLEHLNSCQRNDFLTLLRSYLKDNGKLILSTPNKNFTSPFTKEPLNKFHKIEFTKKTLTIEIEQIFHIKKWHGQRFIPSFLLLKPVRRFIRLLEIILDIDFKIYSEKSNPKVNIWLNKFVQPRILILEAIK